MLSNILHQTVNVIYLTVCVLQLLLVKSETAFASAEAFYMAEVQFVCASDCHSFCVCLQLSMANMN